MNPGIDHAFPHFAVTRGRGDTHRVVYATSRFPEQIHERIVAGGVLVITPYTWLEEHTPHTAWVGGPSDIPFVMRETCREFRHTLAELTTWERLG